MCYRYTAEPASSSFGIITVVALAAPATLRFVNRVAALPARPANRALMLGLTAQMVHVHLVPPRQTMRWRRTCCNMFAALYAKPSLSVTASLQSHARRLHQNKLGSRGFAVYTDPNSAPRRYGCLTESDARREVVTTGKLLGGILLLAWRWWSMLRWSDFALSFYGQWPAPCGFVLWKVGLERF